MQHRLLDMQFATPPVGGRPEDAERPLAVHEPRDGDVTGPDDARVARVARPVHAIPVPVPLLPVARAAGHGEAWNVAALPPRIHTERDDHA